MAGYQKGPYYQYGLRIPIRMGIATHPHLLLTGASGSGKSYALLFLLGRLLQACPETVLYFCDFKNSEDFSFLEGYPHFYAGKDCYQGVMDYYRQFSEIREDRGRHGQKRYLLIFDEYPAFLNYMQAKDKADKTKYAADVLGAVAELLMLGRGIGFGVWIVTQRADAGLFANGARDNFMAIIGLGRMSREQKGMLFAGQEIPEDTYGAGEGLLLADGRELTAVKFPLLRDMENWKKHIRDILLS